MQAIYILLQDYEKIAAYLSNIYQKTLEKKDVATKGWNWGLAKFTGNFCFLF